MLNLLHRGDVTVESEAHSETEAFTKKQRRRQQVKHPYGFNKEGANQKLNLLNDEIKALE